MIDPDLDIHTTHPTRPAHPFKCGDLVRIKHSDPTRPSFTFQVVAPAVTGHPLSHVHMIRTCAISRIIIDTHTCPAVDLILVPTE